MYKAICVMQITGQWEPDPLHGGGGFFVYGKECRSLRRVILYYLIRCLPALVTVHVRDSNTSQLFFMLYRLFPHPPDPLPRRGRGR